LTKIAIFNIVQDMDNGKIVLAQQEKCTNTYKNTKLKLLSVMETILFNKQRQTHHVTPEYRQIRLKNVTSVW